MIFSGAGFLCVSRSQQFRFFSYIYIFISIKHKKYSKETTLSKKIWEIKEKGLEYELKWKILDRAQPFSPVAGVCGLCTQEKWYILFKPELSTLNKREEILGALFPQRTSTFDKQLKIRKIPRDLKI